MSEFYRTKTITLAHGFKDENGARHRVVTLRVPTYGDEVLASGDRVKLMRAGQEIGDSPEAVELLFLLRLIVKWEGIVVPSYGHIMALRRADVEAMRAVVAELDKADMEEASAEAKGDAAKGDASPK